MAEIVFTESEFRFSDPIRYFKENDPYYWEVDNIPIKQLEENVRWVKDQLENQTVTDINRKDFSELKPFVTGEDNVVHVKPGRYTARINDAFNLTPLQIFERVSGQALGDMDVWKVGAMNNASIVDALDRIKERISANFLGMNGLETRSFHHPVINEDKSGAEHVVEFDTETGSGPSVVSKSLQGLKRPIFPLSEALHWVASKVEDTYLVKAFVEEDLSQGFLSLSVAEAHAIKRWRGIARTAIVDVPTELTIAIPSFNRELHSFLDENSEGQIPEGVSSRIDLLFIYSKPIDASSTTTAKFVKGVPTNITKAELGLVIGAGRGVGFVKHTPKISLRPQTGIDADGTPLMIPNAADELMTDGGFTASGIHGSFPSPDDLMNLAPLIAEDLEADNLMLVGQSILPIAYIITRNTDIKNSKGVNIVADSSLVDIRPLMRTTELAYNERAGLAAAMPQVSLANPVVGKAQLDWEIRKLFLNSNAKIKVLENKLSQGQQQEFPRVVSTGYIFGGTNFGVESAFLDYLSTKNNGGTTAQLLSELVKATSLPLNTNIPPGPQWDLSRWIQEGTFSEKGEHPNDYINVHVQQHTRRPADFGCFVNKELTSRATEFGTDNLTGQKGFVSILYVSKTIPFNRDSVNWMGDYEVLVNLWNCVPLSSRAFGQNNEGAASIADIWIDKRDNEFTIYVGWTANDFVQVGSEHKVFGGTTFPKDNRDGATYAGFAVINEDMNRLSNSTIEFPGEIQAGVAIYPTVTFSIIGIPKNYAGHSLGVGVNQTIRLS